MRIMPYLGRKIDKTQPVRVYRNLRKEGVVYSVWQNGVVVGHADEITLYETTFHVNLKGLARVRKQKQREVHAWIEGKVCEGIIIHDFDAQISYNPYKYDTFYNVDTKAPVTAAICAYFNEDGVFINL